ncbi:FAD-dependent oxidoreductase [Lentzea sp. BCCO 10_0061]|uniref:FAD-dependent oxidoreductase n=1 Tax=Lentzea sokolovensis TaxID=3095429 RepID=A0ABU4URZ0_9PSEU|nr:FAD-dependent oxidoreductase [Lentzea sp. BCCO 10_0061]MDX8141571.1 FAD-dependent oxidoreductase [Lentzea sp. BCCO 10_0061]
MNAGRIAVVGSGVSGLTAAYLLRHRHDVVLFEAWDVLGGHTDTKVVAASDGAAVAVDTGFIVHNPATYPNLLRLFGELGVRTAATEMSMSVSCAECGLEYAGGNGGRGLTTRAATGVWRRYTRMLAEIPRFHRAAKAVLKSGDDERTLSDVLSFGGYSRYFVDHYALPLVSAVWSAGERPSGRYPARYLFSFLENHGLLDVRRSCGWRTVVGGARGYVDLIAERLPDVRTGTPIRSVRRHSDAVELVDAAGTRYEADGVVLATHADQALALLADPTDQEKAALGAFQYSRNEMWLHTDRALLPRSARARASWNHRKARCRGGDEVVVSYHMNKLMRLCEPLDYIVTLNGVASVDESAVLARAVYEHPIYTRESVAAQQLLPSLTAGRTAFAGAYHGWGFHEDGCVSGAEAARAFGATW